jgi:hypothetical protein
MSSGCCHPNEVNALWSSLCQDGIDLGCQDARMGQSDVRGAARVETGAKTALNPLLWAMLQPTSTLDSVGEYRADLRCV